VNAEEAAPSAPIGAGRRLDFATEREAMRIVREEEINAGRRVEPLTKEREKREGCDFLSHPPCGVKKFDAGREGRIGDRGRAGSDCASC
jgi:hypothetical protein